MVRYLLHRVGLSLVVVATLGACGGGDELSAPAAYEAEVFVEAVRPPVTPSGSVAVGYPEEPDQWYPDVHAEPAAIDLAHLWGLPLYRIDDAGHLRPALAERASDVDVVDGWGVEIDLRPGTWSDGVPVSAADVVATIDALRADPARAPHLAGLTRAEVVNDDRVRLTFVEPVGRWPYLLAGGWSVLPAHVLATDGLEAFAGPPRVTAGPFRLEGYEAGRSVTFVAHEGSPDGAPALSGLDVAFVPDFETALGLLAAGELDAALGYLALNPVARAEDLPDMTAAAPLGGTSVSISWRASGSLGGPSAIDRRQAVRDAIDVAPQVQGLLGEIAEVSTSWQPTGPGPWGRDAPAPALGGISPTLLIPRWQEATGFTARSLQRDLRTLGGGAELVRLEPDVLVRSTQGDGSLVVRRDGPWPPMLGRITAGDREALVSAARRADLAPFRQHADVVEALALGFDEGHVLPLYRIGVAHVWRPSVTGMQPSSWPGLGFWNVARWRAVDGSRRG